MEKQKELDIRALFEFGYCDTIVAARLGISVEEVKEIREKGV